MEKKIKTEGKNEVNSLVILTVTSLAVILVNINLGALNVALPSIVRHFQANASIANWIVISYMLANTVLILVFGQLADSFDRKKLYLLGMAIFTITSVLIGFAPNGWLFIVLRVIQAAGGALIITNNITLLTDLLPQSELGKAFGMNALVGSVAQLTGPVVGGVIASTFGWEWVFWAGVPFGVLGIWWGMKIFKNIPSTIEKRKDMDWVGGVVACIAFSGLILALSEGGILGWEHWVVISGFALFVLLSPLLVWIEVRVQRPMIDFSLFRDLSFTLANISTFLNSFVRVTVILLISLFLQSVAQMDAFWTGFALLPVTVGMLVASPLAGQLSNFISTRILTTAGLATSAVGLILLMIGLKPDIGYIIAGIGMGLVGFGSGLFLTPNTRAIMLSVPANRRGFANSLRSTFQNFGYVLSTAVSLTIITSMLPMHLQDAVYTGITDGLPVSDLEIISSGFRWALIGLFLTTMIGLVTASFRREKKSS